MTSDLRVKRIISKVSSSLTFGPHLELFSQFFFAGDIIRFRQSILCAFYSLQYRWHFVRFYNFQVTGKNALVRNHCALNGDAATHIIEFDSLFVLANYTVTGDRIRAMK
jgi:hypothetical protein